MMLLRRESGVCAEYESVAVRRRNLAAFDRRTLTGAIALVALAARFPARAAGDI